jgi:hypothetical protein
MADSVYIKRGWGPRCSSVLEYMLSMSGALALIPSNTHTHTYTPQNI